MILLSPAVVSGQATPYVGGSIGASFYRTSLEDATGHEYKLEGEEFAWKIFAGITGGRFFSVEADYRDFGKVQTRVDGTDLESNVTSWDVFAVGNLYLGSFGIFGKAGICWWREESRLPDYPFDVDGNDVAWGLGAVIRLGGLGFRAEFERFELPGDDSLMTLTAGISFGR